MSTAASAQISKAAKAAGDKMALVDDDGSASESDDTEIGIEEEAPVGGDDDSTTSMEEDEEDHNGDGNDQGQAGALGLKAPVTVAAAGVPDFKTARARKSKTSPAKASTAQDEEPELVSGKRRAAAMAHEIIHATSATGQAEARVASAQARAIAEKKKARKRAASTAAKEAIAASGEPPAKRARTSSSTKTKKSATSGSAKTKKSGASGSSKTTAKASAKSSTKAAGKPASKKTTGANAKKTPSTKASATKGATSKATKKPTSKAKAGSSSSSSSAPKTAKKVKGAVSTPKKLPLKDAHTKYRARLAVMPKADFAVLDGAWLSVFDPHLRKRASFPEGHFSPKWTQVLAEVAHEKGATIKGVLPHYATTIEGTDNLKAYEKMPHVVDKDRAEAYAAAGFDQVVAARVYVGPAVLAAGVGESPFAFVHADMIDDAFWQSVKKVLDADSSNDDPIDVVQHGPEAADVEVVA
ncbi:tRNA-synt 1g incomplete domain containing protein [Pandoravirus quercus]|uniref:tRNA-synt 1g incomplete domain containing protein n=1 Tax=Pandoravirus quercus TaxID=2107709 RepID=A0A2U7U8L3_9VIRU|nr:tRNA-synt 1g incomplete domain containing protein [Pandoravirus quercus]AVK74774.1 tRNA-synt 1g incomplete domain containing protein [Pandoravirus quercus]